MKLTSITKKQQEILKLLYRYRFADSRQIEVLMHHKDRRRVGAWLKDLREGGYIAWIYSTDFEKKTKPAIYYLAINGIRFMTSINEYPANEIRKRYRESSRRDSFIAICLLIVECAVHFEMRNASSDSLKYTFMTRADYLKSIGGSSTLLHLNPDIVVEKQTQTRKELVITNYLIQVFDSTLPKHVVRKRLKDYASYIYEEDWRREFNGAEFIVHIVCQTTAGLIYMKQYMRFLLDDTPQDDTMKYIHFTTIDQLRRYGVTGRIWEEI
ncbi:MAG: hypothetical protein JWP06_600 [Candidatus Saccharibacteria bacterium]|nr:hypothetical protein [Candidatus Saccharibacteria bacterium]